MATAPPPARYGATLKARVRAAALPSSYTITGDTTPGSSTYSHGSEISLRRKALAKR